MGIYQNREIPESFDKFWAAEEKAEVEGRALLRRFCSNKLKEERLRGITFPSEFDLRAPNSSVLRSINATLLKQTIKSRPYLECVGTTISNPNAKFIDAKKSTLTVSLISPPIKVTKTWIKQISDRVDSYGESFVPTHISGRSLKTAMHTLDSEPLLKSLDPKTQRQLPYLPKWALKTYRYVRMLQRLAILNAVPITITTSTTVAFDEDYTPSKDVIIEGSIIRLQVNVVITPYNNMIQVERVREISADYGKSGKKISLTELKKIAGEKWASPRYWVSVRDVTPYNNTNHAWEEDEYKKYFMSERALLFIPQLRVILNTLSRITSYGPSVFEVGTGKCSVQISDSEEDESAAFDS